MHTYTQHAHIIKQEVQYKRACEETDIQTRYILMLASYMAWYVCMYVELCIYLYNYIT